MKKYLKLSIIMMIFVTLFSTLLFADEAILTTEETGEAAIEAITLDVPETQAMSTLEILARKLVGSYLVNIFIQGGWLNWPILFLLIWGLTVAIWKMVALTYAKINVTDFLGKVVPLIKDKKYKEALELANGTRGPVGAVIAAGLTKIENGQESVEKAIENTAAIEMSYLEKQLISLSTVITLAPMVGFFGTILGMTIAFDAIAAAGDVDPTIVAEGISVALITTMTGLSVAIPTQLLYNIILQMVDNIVVDMQRAIDKVTETLVENK